MSFIPHSISMPVFMGLMLVIGLFITIYAFNISNDTDKCQTSSSSAKNAAKILIALGVFVTAMAATYLMCGCSKVGQIVHHDNLGMLFVGMLFLIGVFVVVLVSIIQGGCSEAKNSSSVLLMLSSIVVGLSVLYFGYRMYVMYSHHGGRRQLLTPTRPPGAIMSAFG